MLRYHCIRSVECAEAQFNHLVELPLVMQTAQLGAIEPLSQTIILASQADKSAPGSELLRLARAMPQVVYMSNLLDSFKPKGYRPVNSETPSWGRGVQQGP